MTPSAAYECPRCGASFVRERAPGGTYWRCPSCGTTGVGIAVLRRMSDLDSVNRIWKVARSKGRRSTRPCPLCGELAYESTTGIGGDALTLEVCRSCQQVWFDPHELERLPAAAGPEPKLPPPEARHVLALAALRKLDHEAEQGVDSQDPPEDPWKLIPALLGLPYEHGTVPVRRSPLVTWILAGVITVVGGAALFEGVEPIIYQYGLVPADPFRGGGIALLTSFVLHVGWAHLLSNVYFLVVFGDNVESRLGHVRFLLLVALAALAGDAAHVAGDASSTIPVVGASGGISGIVVFYGLAFPKTRIGFFWTWRLGLVPVTYRWLSMPAWFALVVWFALQFLTSLIQSSGFGNVSGLSHLGGAAVGVLFWAVYRETAKTIAVDRQER